MEQQQTKPEGSEDLSGKIFGGWTVLSYSHKGNKYARFWNCACSCGVNKKVIERNLRNKSSQSCGCQKVALYRPSVTKHGMSSSKFYWIWSAMKARCDNPNCTQYGNYGGRGIKLCRRWRTFSLFYKDMFQGYSPDMSLERIKVNWGYSPKNCIWIPKNKQQHNTTNTVRVFYEGKKYTVPRLSELFGIKSKNITTRLRAGWSVKRAINTPIKYSNRKKYPSPSPKDKDNG